MAAASTTNGKKRNDDNYKKKLTKVLSTKLSIEDDDLLQRIATLAYQNGSIKIPSKSEIVRLFITIGLSTIKKEQPSLLFQK